MRLNRFIAKSRIIDLKSTTLEGAIGELLQVCELEDKGGPSKEELRRAILDREKNMTTYLGRGVALPHVRLPMGRSYVFAIGRCSQGLEFEGMEDYRELHLVILLLASEKEKTYLSVLSSVAHIFQKGELVSELISAESLEEFRKRIKKAFGGVIAGGGYKGNKFNRLILKESAKIAKGAGCNRIMVFADTFTEGLDLSGLGGLKIVLVTQSSVEFMQEVASVEATITVRSFSRNRLSQMRSAVLIALSRGILKFDDKLCCVAGTPNSNRFDTVVVVDIAKEFQTVFNHHQDMLPSSIKAEVMERALAIASELAVEGREGKPVGCLFVIGDAKQLKPFTKPLVLNPFYGYKDEDRNILNPFMDETVKEFSTIDGAFIIRGDGVLESAGTLIYAPDIAYELPGGLGSRHAAAAAISKATDCISITVSASTRQVTIFRRGQMLPLI